MRIALVLFLFFAVTLPFFAQSDQANTLLEEGRILAEEKQFDAAVKKIISATSLLKKEEDSSLHIKALFEISKSLLLIDENDKSKKLTYKILRLLPPKDTLSAIAFQILGDIEMKNKKPKKAITFFKKSLELRKEKFEENHPAIAESLLSKGIAQNIIGLPDSASKNIQLALEINQKIFGEKHPKTAEALAALGIIFAKEGNQDYAIEFLQEAIDIFIEHKKEEEFSVIQPYFLLGKTYTEKGRYDLGLMNMQRGLTILENLKGKEHVDRASFLNNIGKIYSQRSEFSEALNYYQEALNLVEDLHGLPHPDVSDSYNNIAEVLRAQGQLDSALIFFEKSLALNKIIYEEDHPKIAQNLSDLGTTFYEMGNLDKATANFNNAYEMFVDTFGTQHIIIAKMEEQIGKTTLKKGGLERALFHFQKALNANVPFQYEALNHLQNPPLDQVLDKKIYLSTLALKSQTLTKLFLDKGKFENLELAYTSFLACDTLIDDLRRSFIDYNDQLVFNRIASKVYEEAIYTCLILKNYVSEKDQNQYVKKAFYFSEKNKSNVLLQSFTNEKALDFADVPDSLRALETIWKIKISVAQKNLVNASQAKDSVKIIKAQQRLLEHKKGYNQFVVDLENSFLKYYQLKYDPSVATLEQVQKNISKDDVLIEFMSGEERIFIFSITADEVFIDMKQKPENYDDFIFNFRKSIIDFDYITHRDSIQDAWTTYTTGAYEIYKFLLEPPLNNFPDKNFKNLTIVPDGILGYLPFEILLKEKPTTEGINYRKLNYLLRDFNISYAFSGTLLLTQIEADVVNKNIQYGGFAPVYGDGKLSLATSKTGFLFSQKENYIDLPASRKGVEYIADLLDGDAYLNQEATEQIFRDTAAQYDILHLAMHGVYDDKDPLNSHLVFTQFEEEKQNNLLTAAELYNLNLGASLVFIGACNSGFGKINRGEGIMSLSRAFAYSGCPSIVMSLWSVPDDETAKITNSFFQKIKNGDTKSEALRQAKLDYLNDSNVPPDRLHPLFWAGFVPIGEMSPLYTPDEISNTWTLLAAISVLALTIFIGRRVWRRYGKIQMEE